MLHPYQDLCHLLREYQMASDAEDFDGAYNLAVDIHAAADNLVKASARLLNAVPQKNLPYCNGSH